MITDQKTIDALKELNYTQVYEKGKEDARQEIEKVFERVLNRIIGKIQDSRNNGEMIIDYCKKIKQQLNSEKKK